MYREVVKAASVHAGAIFILHNQSKGPGSRATGSECHYIWYLDVPRIPSIDDSMIYTVYLQLGG